MSVSDFYATKTWNYKKHTLSLRIRKHPHNYGINILQERSHSKQTKGYDTKNRKTWFYRGIIQASTVRGK